MATNKVYVPGPYPQLQQPGDNRKYQTKQFTQISDAINSLQTQVTTLQGVQITLTLPSPLSVTGSPVTGASGALSATWGSGTIPLANLPTMTATVSGLPPTPPNDITKWLNSTGVWLAIPAYAVFTSSVAGLVPASGVTNLSTDYLGGDAAFHALPAPPTLTVPTYKSITTAGSGTYTPSTGVTWIKVRLQGGGAGGAAESSNAGVAGTTSSFSSWTAVGGSPGTVGTTPGGAGGAGGTGGTNGTGTLIVRIAGGHGQGGAGTGTAGEGQGGNGGCSAFGGNGGGGLNNKSTAGAGAGYTASANSGSGGGGAGGGSGGSGTATGGGGGAGEYVEFIMTAAQIGASLSYVLGGGGAGGAAGTNAGGAGGSGVILVEEHYY